jgi:hypothetical protein
MPPAPGISPNPASGWAKIADSRAEAHVARQHELAAACTCATFDLCDGDEAACAQMAKQQAERRFADQLRRLIPILLDPGHIDVGDEIVGICALEHKHLAGPNSLGILNERDQIADESWAQEVHWRGHNLRE